MRVRAVNSSIRQVLATWRRGIAALDSFLHLQLLTDVQVLIVLLSIGGPSIKPFTLGSPVFAKAAHKRIVFSATS